MRPLSVRFMRETTAQGAIPRRGTARGRPEIQEAGTAA